MSGGMLVVSVSVAGLVTLAAMTQPSLAPEAKNSLLQYVTGKYLHSGNTQIVFHWTDPQPVGQSTSFTISVRILITTLQILYMKSYRSG